MRPCQLGRKLRHNLFFWYLSDAVRFGGIYVPDATVLRAGAKRWKPATLHRGIQVISSHRFGFPFGRRFSIHRFTQMGFD